MRLTLSSAGEDRVLPCKMLPFFGGETCLPAPVVSHFLLKAQLVSADSSLPKITDFVESGQLQVF